jgi:acetyl esterase/lipase
MPRACVTLSIPVLLMFTIQAVAAEKPSTFDVFPGNVPGETGKIGEEKFLDQKPGEKAVKRLTNVSKPSITVFSPTKAKNTGAAVLICPGGGYNILAWDLEGEEVAAWLNSLGVTGIVLKYRVPRRPEDAKNEPPPGPLQDAQRAMSLVRSKAKEFGIDPKRIGILGFSAGGHLAATTALQFDKRTYPPIDDIDQIGCRPDFAVLIYPAYLTSKDKGDLLPTVHVSKDSPPMFFAHAANDGVKADNSVQLFLALRRAGVPAELHVYATGGHGFGLRPSENPCSTWPARCAEWMRVSGLLR